MDKLIELLNATPIARDYIILQVHFSCEDDIFCGNVAIKCADELTPYIAWTFSEYGLFWGVYCSREDAVMSAFVNKVASDLRIKIC